MINSRDPDDLLPEVRDKCLRFIAECQSQGIHVNITSTYRDLEAQAELYSRGRTTKGRRVTNAGPGQSYHNYRVAFDFVPIVNGKAAWKNTGLFERCGIIAESVGLEWAGRWTEFPEQCHCQYTGGKTIQQLRRTLAA